MIFSTTHLAIICLIILLPNSVFGQVFRCYVVDLATQKPVPYASISSVKFGNGIHADEDGYFEWNKTKQNDSVIVSSVGYKSLKVNVDLLENEVLNRLALSPDTVVLKEIVIRPGSRKTIREIGFYSYSTAYEQGMAAGGISDNEVFLNYCNNTEQAEGILSRLLFDLNGSWPGQGRSKARIRVMSVDSLTGLPGKDVLPQDIIVAITPFSHNIMVDVEKYKIPFSREGIFIGLEFICNIRFIYKKQSLKKRKSTCPIMPMAKEPNYRRIGKGYHWTKHGNKYQWVCLSDGSTYPSKSYQGMVFKFGAKIISYEN